MYNRNGTTYIIGRNNKLPEKGGDTMYTIVYDNETVVYDSNNSILVKCPTEQEANEYINDHAR
jgi:hypothetical protein